MRCVLNNELERHTTLVVIMKNKPRAYKRYCNIFDKNYHFNEKGYSSTELISFVSNGPQTSDMQLMQKK